MVPSFSKRRLEPWRMPALDQTGGGKSRSWYLYMGTIPPGRFRSIEQLAGSADVTTSAGAMAGILEVAG
jgi:hypothetical protein